MSIEIIISIISALGGVGVLEFIKWLSVRRHEARISDARADTEEFRALREYNDFLQERLIDKEKRFEEQTQIVRRLNGEVITLTRQVAERDVELAVVRCEDKQCPYRKPPTAYTLPDPGVSKAAWHEQKGGVA